MDSQGSMTRKGLPDEFVTTGDILGRPSIGAVQPDIDTAVTRPAVAAIMLRALNIPSP
ncbi:transcriptional regulator [Mycobacteroides immunogenum]|nr:transcriptional regulator [Mycobacteroides immunogenum]KPG47836.1 transcriptional regulator [Mycobacteroides immunogenum]KPG54122.1 transcriptional regulator [Mycobacteroides immunogenum]